MDGETQESFVNAPSSDRTFLSQDGASRRCEEAEKDRVRGEASWAEETRGQDAGRRVFAASHFSVTMVDTAFSKHVSSVLIRNSSSTPKNAVTAAGGHRRRKLQILWFKT